MRSIRRRLLAWLLSALALTGLLASALTYFQAQEDVSELFDYQLRQIAFSLRYQPASKAIPEQSDADDEDAPDFVAQVWDRDGTLVYTSHRHLRLPRFSDRGLATHAWQGEDWRVYVMATANHVIQVAQPMDARREMAATVALRILVPVLVLIPFLGSAIWFSVAQGLRPLRAIGAALATRTPSALAPLPDDGQLPSEVAPLVAALNNLLGRLSSAIEGQRKFVADAAHELRTPLTAVQLQLQLVERAETPSEHDAALAQLKSGVGRATHLVQQLLALARAEPDAARPVFALVALDELARSVAADYAALAVDKGIDLGVVRASPVRIRGDAESLRVMLGNLVDNAIRYTPAGGRIDLAAYVHDSEAVLEVTDTGPGLAPGERERVFDRFYRGPGQGVPGSGLGLAIVKNIVDRHRGRISFDTGKDSMGLKVKLVFASAATPTTS